MATLALATITTAYAAINDVTAEVEILGNPFRAVPVYARNVWSMFPFNGLLYLGYGNASDLEPDAYSGYLDIMAFNPTNASFLSQDTVSEQQIDHYRVLNGQLVAPGFNPNSLIDGNGDFYIQRTNGWKQFATVPDGVHTFDMLEFNGEWFAALGCYSNTIVSSTNGGATWQVALSPNLATVGNTGERVYSLFQLGGTLYSMTRVLLPNHNLAPTLLRYNTNAGFFVTNSPASSYALTNFCPNTSIPYDQDYCIARTTNVGDKLVYILGLVTNDMQWDPMGLYWATNVSGGTKVNLPSGTKPWDIMQNSNGVWVLEASPVSGSSDFWVQVVGTQDFVNWSEVLRFRSSTFARSFGQLDGDLYFGLGCETNSL